MGPAHKYARWHSFPSSEAMGPLDGKKPPLGMESRRVIYQVKAVASRNSNLQRMPT